jgi:invasion protein IalB
MHWSSLRSVAGVALGWLLVMAGSAAAGSGWEQPMRLGVEPSSSFVPARAARKPGAFSECQKWRTLAARLGETYAGVRLRRTVVERACAFAEPDAIQEPVWSWPWRDGGEIDPGLPPRLHLRSGAWTIRCGLAGRRERCALIHEASVEIGPPAGPETVPVTTHFVIDTIVGEQRLLWRVLGPWSHDWKATGREPGSKPTSLVRVALGAAPREAPFATCTSAGCLMEANVRLSAEAATHLWEGRPLVITLTPRPDTRIELGLPARGFRAALGELSRMKRQEERVLAGR